MNKKIQAAAANGESWTKDPSKIAGALTGDWITAGEVEEPSSRDREIIGESKRNKEGDIIAVVTVKEIGLFDDATRQIDHVFEFRGTKDKGWLITKAFQKSYNARPPFPDKNLDIDKQRTGRLLALASAGREMSEFAAKNGIENLGETLVAALDGDKDALKKILGLSTKVEGINSSIYAEMLWGISMYFDHSTFQRFLVFEVDEKQQEMIGGFLAWIRRDLLPAK